MKKIYKKKNQIDKQSGLDKNEKETLEYIAKAWNSFAELPIYHPDHIEEFKFHIHSIQRIIAMRIAKRDYPNYWGNECSKKHN